MEVNEMKTLQYESVAKHVVVIGAGGFGREVAQTIEDIYLHDRSLKFIAFLDDNKELHGKKIMRREVYPLDIEWLKEVEPYFVCAIGDPKTKKKVVEKAIQLGLEPISVIHPKTSVYTKDIGVGVVIQPGSRIAVDSVIEDHAHINFNCVIGHDAYIGAFSTISPLCGVEGFTHLEEGVFLGSNASVIPSVRIGKYTKIGAQATVIRDCKSYSTYVGVPAKWIKSHDPELKKVRKVR